MSPRKRAPKPIPGAIHQCRYPNFEPLLAIVGTELTAWFMWMGEIRLDDGGAVHAYKHRSTRRYFHLAEDGRAFEFLGAPIGSSKPSTYRPISRSDAFDEPFFQWGAMADHPEDLKEEYDLIDEARRIAAQGETIPVDPAELELQRAFDERRRQRFDDEDARAA